MTAFSHQVVALPVFTVDDYNKLTKPGLLLWVYLSSLVTYIFTVDEFSFWGAVCLLVGIYLTGAAAHVFNQYIEIDSDAKMARTKNRPFVLGKLSSGNGIFIGMSMLLFGYGWMFVWFNPLTAFLCLLSFLLYVFAYTPLKKISVWNTWVGAVPGALPAIIGDTAATGMIGNVSIYFFILLFFWQIPHFLSLSWKYRNEYAGADFKMLSLADKEGTRTLTVIIVHGLLLMLTCATAYYFIDGLGLLYTVCIVLLCADLMLKTGKFGFNRTDKNAMKIFFNSLYFIPVMYGALITDAFLI